MHTSTIYDVLPTERFIEQLAELAIRIHGKLTFLSVWKAVIRAKAPVRLPMDPGEYLNDLSAPVQAIGDRWAREIMHSPSASAFIQDASHRFSEGGTPLGDPAAVEALIIDRSSAWWSKSRRERMWSEFSGYLRAELEDQGLNETEIHQGLKAFEAELKKQRMHSVRVLADLQRQIHQQLQAFASSLTRAQAHKPGDPSTATTALALSTPDTLGLHILLDPATIGIQVQLPGAPPETILAPRYPFWEPFSARQYRLGVFFCERLQELSPHWPPSIGTHLWVHLPGARQRELWVDSEGRLRPVD